MSKYNNYSDVIQLMESYDNNTIHEMITNGELSKEAIEIFNGATRLGDYRMKGFTAYEQPIAVDIPKDVSETYDYVEALTDTTSEVAGDVNQSPNGFAYGEVTGGYDNYEEAGFDSYSDYAGASMAEGMGGTYDSDTGTISFEYDPNFESPFMEENIPDDKLPKPGAITGRHIRFDWNDTETLLEKLKKINRKKGDILSIIANLYTKFELLNDETKTELKTTYTISNEDLRDYLIKTSVYPCFDSLEDKIKYVQGVMDGTIELDNDSKEDAKTGDLGTITVAGSSHSGGSNSSSASSNSNISDIQTGVVNSNISLLASLVGTITFTEIIPLYKEIGGISNISASLNSNYGLMGIVQKDGKYYYKLLDAKTNETYYTEINDKMKIETNFKELAEIKEPAMMLNSTEIGTNNFVKLAEQGTLFFVQDKLENNGLAFLDVLDSTDGKSYYIPQGDEVGLISLETLTSSIIGSE